LVLHAHLTEAPPAPSERNPALPRELDAVVATAMDKDPRRRQPSVEAFVRAAAEALGLQVAIPVVRAPKPKTAPAIESAARPAPKPAARPAAERRRPAPEPTRAPPGPRRAPARTPAPARTRSERRRERPSRTSRRRRGIPRLAPLLGGLALLASAVAGFASGSSGSDGPSVSESPTQVAAAGPTSVPQNVDNAVERLDVRRVAARRKLRAARRPQGQALAAQALAGAYGAARARLAKDGIEGDSETRLADRLEAVEAAYRDLASAARSASSKRWKAASEATRAREFDLELLLRNRQWN
jgi:hypothetical protein